MDTLEHSQNFVKYGDVVDEFSEGILNCENKMIFNVKIENMKQKIAKKWGMNTGKFLSCITLITYISIQSWFHTNAVHSQKSYTIK